jgi:excinuclease ABC subunit C
VEYLCTDTEKEALLLEASLIKKHRPRYNVVLRDDKQYVLFKLNKAHKYPRLTLTRRVVRDGSAYFGPFTSAAAARDTLKAAGRLFPLRKCGDHVLRNRVRPCLYHHIGECPAPCVEELPEGLYQEMVRRTELLLSGRSRELTETLERRMRECSERLEYEKAAELRDQIAAVRATVERQAAVLDRPLDLDALALAETEKGLGLGLLYVRRGRLTDKKTFFWPGLGLADGPEVLEGFINQFYAKERYIPDRILTPWPPEDPALAESLSERRGSAVRISEATTGMEKKLLDMARSNAREHAARASAEDEASIVQKLARALKLGREPARIEAVDVSHLSGGGAVVGQAVYEGGRPAKDEYRVYKLPDLEGSADDYRALAGWAERRVRSGPPWPDLVLVDGGRGQLQSVRRALAENDAHGLFELASIAKAKAQGGGADRRAGALEDKVYRPDRKNPLPLAAGSAEMLFLQRLRDAAHRFAVRGQQRSRKKRLLDSELMSVPGVGPKTARLLWDRFGSLEAMRQAAPEDIAGVPGLGPRRAEAILRALGNRP